MNQSRITGLRNSLRSGPKAFFSVKQNLVFKVIFLFSLSGAFFSFSPRVNKNDQTSRFGRCLEKTDTWMSQEDSKWLVNLL